MTTASIPAIVFTAAVIGFAGLMRDVVDNQHKHVPYALALAGILAGIAIGAAL